jgi:hypothetical protein
MNGSLKKALANLFLMDLMVNDFKSWEIKNEMSIIRLRMTKISNRFQLSNLGKYYKT